jgi:AbrB family looped-hinge helix DNA binding protein
MKNSSTISSKGQITVSQEIRRRLGLETGDRVEFVMEQDRTVIRQSARKSIPSKSSQDFPKLRVI